jgi:hypothetical protein
MYYTESARLPWLYYPALAALAVRLCEVVIIPD